jgi:hypothetical protein
LARNTTTSVIDLKVIWGNEARAIFKIPFLFLQSDMYFFMVFRGYSRALAQVTAVAFSCFGSAVKYLVVQNLQ